jgi:hypothetical protein
MTHRKITVEIRRLPRSGQWRAWVYLPRVPGVACTGWYHKTAATYAIAADWAGSVVSSQLKLRAAARSPGPLPTPA